jgi:hypothetical protein
MRLDLGGLTGAAAIVAIDTRAPWRELRLGTVTPGVYQFTAPGVSDWALAVDSLRPEPLSSLEIRGTDILLNGRPTFLIGQMDVDLTTGRSVEEVAAIVDTMMVPFGMNLFAGRLGQIYWGAWNNRVNVERGLVSDIREHRYAWMRTGPGETEFGGPRFDLTRHDDTYFQFLDRMVRLLNERGIVPVVGMFSEHAIDHPLHWRGHPFHPANNVNGLGLPVRDAIPEFFTSPAALDLQEAYARKVLAALGDSVYILAPFGEMRRAPADYIQRILAVVRKAEVEQKRDIALCLSGSSDLLRHAALDPTVDMIDVYCYHGGRYDDAAVNIPNGGRGLTQTVTVALEGFGKPVVKFYHKYGYPYANTASPWADPKTGTEDGGPPSAAATAVNAVAGAGGSGFFLKMSWARDRGIPMTPDAWSWDVAEFVSRQRRARLPDAAAGGATLTAAK